MARIITYVMILVGVLATFAILGIGNTATGQLLNAISFNDPSKIKDLDLFNLLFGTTAGIIATLGLAGTLIIGIFGRQSTSDIVIIPFATALAGWIIGDLASIILIGNNIPGIEFSAFSSIVKVFVYVLIAGGVISMVQWWRGSGDF